ncbi:TadE/TadG family type IV pilus assembly protein [Mesorhizobium sp. CU2]|uniref:TadE/TadG family type IV pilus assembly protein n=1 Tax=unclassified Mesorhizobium TaxID=325217 RepID=UPI00387E7147
MDPTSGEGIGNRAPLKPRPGFFSDKRGGTAIEFGLLAIPFALLVFAILESCISFAGQEVMANATDDVARQLRTGQLQQNNVNMDSIKTAICNRLQIIVANGCPGLFVDLREYTSFADAATAGFTIVGNNIQLTQGGSNMTFQAKPGLAESINMLRVFYKWPVMTNILEKQMQSFPDGTTLHFASVTWQSEPFNDN